MVPDDDVVSHPCAPHAYLPMMLPPRPVAGPGLGTGGPRRGTGVEGPRARLRQRLLLRGGRPTQLDQGNEYYYYFIFFTFKKIYIYIYFYLSSYLVTRVSVYLFLFYLFIYLVYIFVLFCFEHELLLAGSVKDFVEIRHICKLLVLRGAIVSRTKYC